jgi:kynurenine formamidase
VAAAIALVVVSCATPRQAGSSMGIAASGWIDATATLDPATTPVYEGDAPMKFDFLHDMRKGDGFTLSVYSIGAHSGTHVYATMHFVLCGATIDHLPLDPFIG